MVRAFDADMNSVIRRTAAHVRARGRRRPSVCWGIAVGAVTLATPLASPSGAQQPSASEGRRAPGVFPPAPRAGELRVGDRIVLLVPGVTALNDTFVVHAGRMLELLQIPPISVAGVPRAEAEHHLRVQLARYVRDTGLVRARALVRIGVVGEVNNPGYYAVAPDALVGDVLMRAGGLAHTADVRRISVRRGVAEIWKGNRLQDAIVQGATLDELDLSPGDEIVVGQRRDWAQVARDAALFASVIFSALIATRAIHY